MLLFAKKTLVAEAANLVALLNDLGDKVTLPIAEFADYIKVYGFEPGHIDNQCFEFTLPGSLYTFSRHEGQQISVDCHGALLGVSLAWCGGRLMLSLREPGMEKACGQRNGKYSTFFYKELIKAGCWDYKNLPPPK